jgi:hypothetical protein
MVVSPWASCKPVLEPVERNSAQQNSTGLPCAAQTLLN